MAIQISVIVAAYNCEKTVGIAINSILKQRFQNFELLVADDLSSDDTRNIIDSFKDARIRTFHNSEKLHVCGTWNKLLAKATGKYVTFHDADDVSYTNWLHRLNEHAEANSNCAVVGANHLRPFNWWGWYNISNFKLSYSEILNAAIYSSKVESFGARSLFLRSCVNELGGFRVLYQGCGWEDYDLFLRILERHEVFYINDIDLI
jgi:glycosyltransferase involved in cell wall biosynthesis